MDSELLVIERLVYKRWGGAMAEAKSVQQSLKHMARRQKWTFETVPEVSSYPSSYQAFEWRDRYGAGMGWSLHVLNIAAVSTRRPEWGLPPEFHLTSEGRLFEALSADGFFILPDADWLLAPLSPTDKAAIAASPVNGGWEAYNLKHWKPHTRAEALFTHWD